MATVHWDTVQDNRGRLTEDGWEFYRAAIVTGIKTTASTPSNRLIEAVSALGLSIGQVHPSISYVFLRSFEPQAIDDEKVRVHLIYSQVNPREYPEEGQSVINIGSSVIQTETHYDKNGDSLGTVEHTYPNDDEDKKLYGDLAGETITQQVSVSKMIPQHILSIQTRLAYSPGPLAASYVGKVNHDNWSDGAAKTWLCTAINGVSRDGGVTYDCTFEFQYNPDTWVGYYVFVDSVTGLTVAPVGGAVVDCDIYQTADFGALPI